MSEEQQTLLDVPQTFDDTHWPPPWFTIGSTTPRIWIERVRNGRHPFGAELGPEESRCRGCRHRTPHQMAKTYWKCDVGPQSHGKATDVQAQWRGCVLFAPKGG